MDFHPATTATLLVVFGKANFHVCLHNTLQHKLVDA